MQYKDVMLYIDDGVSNPERVNATLGLASHHGACVTAVTLAALKPEHVRVKDEDALKRISEKAAQERLDAFLSEAKAQGVKAESLLISGSQSKAVRQVARLARNFDLIVLRQSNPKKQSAAIIEKLAEQVILRGGRPVFFMPYIGAHRIPCRKAAIAWDGSATATRAVHDALPLLIGLKQVTILIVEGKKKTKRGKLLADYLSKHLINHGVNAVVSRRHKGDMDVASIILNEIAENDIDLLIMGGYGTSSLKEKVFGGVTQTLLSSMIVPVVMSH